MRRTASLFQHTNISTKHLGGLAPGGFNPCFYSSIASHQHFNLLKNPCLISKQKNYHHQIGSLNHVLDRRELSPNEQIMLVPSLLKYGNGVVLRVITFDIHSQTQLNTEQHVAPFNSVQFESLLRSAIDRVQKTQPLLRSRIKRNDTESQCTKC